MKNFLKLLLGLMPLVGLASQCPSVASIKRLDGEYAWRTWQKGWVGGFAVPLSHGQSYRVSSFLKAEWFQLKDTQKSPGYIACYYQGDCADEIIRFVQETDKVVQRPHGIHWYCECGICIFPSAACKCSSNDPALCKFE